MTTTSLVFSELPATGVPAHLVFGDSGSTPTPVDVTVSLVAAVTSLSGSVEVTRVFPLAIAGQVTRLSGTASVVYDSATERPMVGSVGAEWQDATAVNSRFGSGWRDGIRVDQVRRSVYQNAATVFLSFEGRWFDSIRSNRPPVTAGFTEAEKVTSGSRTYMQQAVQTRASRSVRFARAVPSRVGASSRFEEAYRDRRNWAAAEFSNAVAKSKLVWAPFQYGLLVRAGFDLVYQPGMRPPPGLSPVTPPQPEDPCYIPNAHLVFTEIAVSETKLVFICERHSSTPGGATIVVPIQRVYVVVNSATLTRVSDGGVIPTTSMTMSLDVDSWTWSFSASVPGAALALVSRVAGEPVEVLATLNGAPYRFIIEQVSRERTFGSSSLRVSGRGRAAFLDTPYAPTQNFINTESRTAQQLMGDVLTINGVPLGWGINWSPEDWSVPAGAFVHQGSMMSALTTIAASTGAYIRPHPVNQELDVLLKYPVAPWEWGAVTPDYELPSAVVTKEGVEWLEKAEYNRVYVGGAAVGVFGPVTRAGTDGALVAQTVTDALITAAAPHRQRGLTVLSDTGRQEKVTLSLPVLAETGIIPPGKFVRYVDGATTRLGLTRAVSVSLGQSAVDLRQEIVLETHI